MIRYEQHGDEKAIRDLTVAAFEDTPHSDGSEASIISGLREDGDLTLSLVAIKEGDIVGHIAFSSVTIEGEVEGWYGLGPLSVSPDRQRQGVGSALVNEGLSILKAQGAKGCVVVGEPSYYERFGFHSDGKVSYGQLPRKYVQSLSFREQAASGEVRYCPAFER